MDQNKQTEVLLREGGIADDGMTQDPISGNEVPSGSMSSEVRDDVPAQLSEGEYVVPADVVRYYGVKHFENLRNKAKDGLNKMEADGRIGGEPVPLEGGGLTPEEEEVLNMAMGGLVGGTQGYAPGGIVSKNVAPQYTMSSFLFGPPPAVSPDPVTPDPVTPSTPEDSSVVLYGPGGSTVSLTLPAQQTEYDAYLAQGYSTTQSIAPSSDGSVSSNEGTPIPPGTAGGTGSSSYGEDPSYGLGGLGGSVLGGVAGLVVGGLGGVSGGVRAGKQADSFNEARNDLVEALNSGDEKAIKKAEADITSTYDNLSTIARLGVQGEGGSAEETITSIKEAVDLADRERRMLDTGYDPSTDSFGVVAGQTTSTVSADDYQGPTFTGAGYTVNNPADGGSDPTEIKSDSSGGLYKAITGTAFEDTVVGKALGLGSSDTETTGSTSSGSTSSGSTSSGSTSSGSTSSGSTSSSGGLYKAITGTAFEDTAVGKALGLGSTSSGSTSTGSTSSGSTSSGGGGWANSGWNPKNW